MFDVVIDLHSTIQSDQGTRVWKSCHLVHVVVALEDNTLEFSDLLIFPKEYSTGREIFDTVISISKSFIKKKSQIPSTVQCIHVLS